jgi:hypothetical protein
MTLKNTIWKHTSSKGKTMMFIGKLLQGENCLTILLNIG